MPRSCIPLGRSETGHARKSAAGAVSDPAVSGRGFHERHSLEAECQNGPDDEPAVCGRNAVHSDCLSGFSKSGDEDIRRLDAFCELAASVLHGFLDAGHEYRVCWYDMEKKSGEEKIIRNEEDYRGMLKELILCASYSGETGGNPKEMPEIYQF